MRWTGSLKGREYGMRSSHFFFNDTATTEIYTLSLHDALPICRRFHLRKRGFNRASDLQRVRAILTGDDEDHAGSSLNGRGPNHRFGTIRNGGDISQSHAAAVLVPQDNVAELVWRKTLSFCSKDHALGRGTYESGSADTSSSPR